MMKYIKDTLDFKIEEPSVITLGKFDGLHTGHRYLMDAMQKGKEQGLKCVIFTFDIPPKAIHKDAYSVLSTNEEKAHIFAEAGVDYLVECPFTDEFRQLSPYAFLQMLKEKINVKMIVAGFIVFMIQIAGEWIVTAITALNMGMRNFIRS